MGGLQLRFWQSGALGSNALDGKAAAFLSRKPRAEARSLRRVCACGARVEGCGVSRVEPEVKIYPVPTDISSQQQLPNIQEIRKGRILGSMTRAVL